MDDSMKLLIAGLADKLSRLPTEQEVWTFIFGSEEQRAEVWNGGIESDDNETARSHMQ